jgi:hypothetical protein
MCHDAGFDETCIDISSNNAINVYNYLTKEAWIDAD